ncbi:flavodoxin [Mesotoga sp. SC_4PWA21]|nr:flavodoxin [Mesotoga sp. SC_4PWA21]
MKSIVVYFSYDESTRALAEAMASSIDADLLRLVPTGEFSRTYYHHVENPEQIETTPGYDPDKEHIWGSESVTMNNKPELEPYGFDPDNYDLIIIGSPVWALTYAPPLSTFLAENKLEGKKIALFCTHDGMIGAALENLKKALKGNEVIQEIDFEAPSSRLDEYVETAKEWARELGEGL